MGMRVCRHVCSKCGMTFVMKGAYNRHVTECRVAKSGEAQSLGGSVAPIQFDPIRFNSMGDEDFAKHVMQNRTVLHHISNAPETRAVAPKFHSSVAGIAADSFIDDLLADVDLSAAANIITDSSFSLDFGSSGL